MLLALEKGLPILAMYFWKGVYGKLFEYDMLATNC